jgi:hypothetical protein
MEGAFGNEGALPLLWKNGRQAVNR